MANTPKVSVILELLDKMTQPLNGAKSSVESFGSKAVGVFKAVAASAAALVLGKFFKDSVGEAMRAELAFSQLEATVKSTGGAAGFTARELKGQADALARLTNFSSEAVQGGLARLLGYTDIQGTTFQRATRAALDMAQVLGIDVTSASERVGNALNYPTQAINSLTKQGFRFTDEQKRMIAEMERAGNIAGAQAIILGELELAYGGSAEAAGKTFAGALDKVGKAWDDVKEAVGRAIIGTEAIDGHLGWLVETLAEVEQWVVANEGAISEFAAGVANAFRAIGEVVKVVTSVLMVSISGWTNLFAWVGVAATELGFAFDGIAPAAKKMAGNVLISLSSLVGESRVILAIFGDAATDLANRMGNAGVRMVREASRAQRDIKAGRELYYRELGAITGQGELTLNRATEAGGNRRKELTKEELDAIEKARKAAAKRLEDLSEEILVKEIRFQHNMTEAQAKAYIQRERDLGNNLRAQVTSMADAYRQMDGLNTLLAAGFNQRVTPAVQQTRVAMMQMATSVPPLTDQYDRLARQTGLTRDEVVKLVDAGKVYSIAAGEWVDRTDKATESFGKNARAAAGVAGEIGLIDKEGEKAVGSMVSLGESISSVLAGGLTAGGVIGIIGGTMAVLKGLFGGKSPSQVAAERALAKNTQTIEENSRKVGDLTRLQSSGGKLVGVQGALEGANLTNLAKLGKGFEEVVHKNLMRDLPKLLLKSGLGMGDLDAVAKDLGITIRDDKGRLNAQMLQQLLQMLGEIEPTEFAQTFAGGREKLRHETDLFGLSPAEQAKRLTALAGGPLGSSVIGQRLGGLDFTTAEGRAAGIAAIQQLFQDLPGLSAGDLGGLTGSEFLTFLSDLKGLLTTDVPAAVTTGVAEGLGEGAGGGVGGVVPPTGTPVPSVSLADLVLTATRSEDYLALIADHTSYLPTLTGPMGGVERSPRLEIHGGLHVSVTAPAGAGGAETGAEIARAIDDELGRLYRERLMALGDVRRT